jgi:hypothetical protein
MSIREAELSRSRHAQRSHQKEIKRRRSRHQRRPVPALPAILHDSQVLTVPQWCALANFSLRTGRRILASGTGPVVIQLSDKRIGITVRADREWKARRARPRATNNTTP